MKRLFLLLLISGISSIQLFAQCDGVYFKDKSRQVLSNSFAAYELNDLNNDSQNDIFGYSVISPSSFRYDVYLRQNSESFNTNAATSTINNVNDKGILADVNNDGHKDLIIKHTSNPPILTTYLNDGTGKFSTNTIGVPVTDSEKFDAAGDLNGDGKADLLSYTFTTNSTRTVYYRLAQSDNSFGEKIVLSTFESPGFIKFLVEDINNDGNKDIVVTLSQMNGERLLVLTGNGDLTYTQSATYDFDDPTNLRTVDVNNDGKKDFVSRVFSDPVGKKIKILVNTGSNSFNTTEVVVPSVYSESNYYVTNNASFGDFDADGDVDIILLNAKKYLLVENQGNLTFTKKEFNSFQKIDSTELFNNDNKTDIITIERPFLDGFVRLISPNAVYLLHNVVRFRQNVCKPVGQTKFIDFDGDGFTDRAFWNPANGVWRYYTGNEQADQVYFNWGSGSLGDVPVPNDYDGDGITDYAVYRKPDGNWWIYRSSDQQVSVLSFGLPDDIPIPSDYDGDGKADIAIYRKSEGQWWIYRSSDQQISVSSFGIAEDKPVPADYDGDGNTDIAVYRPSTGVWYRINSSDNSFFAVQYGISTDDPVPGDFDEDGKANIAVFRDGTWYVLRSDYSTSIFYWGTTNDSVFLGRTKFEPAAFVFRKTENSIYTNKITIPVAGYEVFNTGNSFNEILVSSILRTE